jgi:hypothetical protein
MPEITPAVISRCPGASGDNFAFWAGCEFPWTLADAGRAGAIVGAPAATCGAIDCNLRAAANLSGSLSSGAGGESSSFLDGVFTLRVSDGEFLRAALG